MGGGGLPPDAGTLAVFSLVALRRRPAVAETYPLERAGLFGVLNSFPPQDGAALPEGFARGTAARRPAVEADLAAGRPVRCGWRGGRLGLHRRAARSRLEDRPLRRPAPAGTSQSPPALLAFQKVAVPAGP